MYDPTHISEDKELSDLPPLKFFLHSVFFRYLLLRAGDGFLLFEELNKLVFIDLNFLHEFLEA
jgi:hypothetical protein